MFGGSSAAAASLRPESAIEDEPDSGGSMLPSEPGTTTTTTTTGSSSSHVRKPSKSTNTPLASPSTSLPDAKKGGGPSLTAAVPTFDRRKGSSSSSGGGNHSPPASATDAGTEKKRRSSGVGGRASSLLASAKNSLSFGQVGRALNDAAAANQTPLQKLGKQDAALAVPQGQHNNSAGESVPGPRSTFRVGVWEDRNKKCRRTMEDTHAFLYNFLRTPSPATAAAAAAASRKDRKDSASLPPLPPPPPSSSPTKLSANSVSASDVAVSASSSSSSVDDRAVADGPPLETDNGYFAIFDGHAGTFAADWCGKKVHLILEDTLRKNPGTPVPELLDQTFTSVDAQLEKLPLKNSGCTAAIAVLRWEDRVPSSQSATGSQNLAVDVAADVAAAAAAAAEEAVTASKTATKIEVAKPDEATPPASAERKRTSIASSVGGGGGAAGGGAAAAAAAPVASAAHSRQRVLYTANVGDARIILCRAGTALRLSYDHKGSDENEGRRVTSAGGLILNNRVNGVLAVTRALGDTYIKGLVTGRPYTTETVIQPETDEFLIVACDGLWDVCSDQEAVDLVRSVQDPHTAAKMLVDHALDCMSTDNLSCMIVRFDQAAMAAVQTDKVRQLGVEGDGETEIAAASAAGAVSTASTASTATRTRRPSEADAIVRSARQKIATGAVPAVGVSASNSGRGHDPVPSPTTARAAASAPASAPAAAPAEEPFQRTAIKESVQEEAAAGGSSTTSGSVTSDDDSASVQTASTTTTTTTTTSTTTSAVADTKP